MSRPWDWADVAAAGIIARFLHEQGMGHTVRWVIDGGFNETQRELIAAGIRYGAREAAVTPTIRPGGSYEQRFRVELGDRTLTLSKDRARDLFAALSEVLQVEPMFVNGRFAGFIGGGMRRGNQK